MVFFQRLNMKDSWFFEFLESPFVPHEVDGILEMESEKK